MQRMYAAEQFGLWADARDNADLAVAATLC